MKRCSQNIRTYLWLGILSISSATRVRAQAIEAGVVVVSANHELLGDPLYGGSVAVRFPIRRSRQSLRFGFERVGGNAERFGVACAGLVDPDRCHDETLIDHSRLVRFTGGLGFPVFVKQRGTVAVIGDLTLGRIRSVTRGVSSGGTLNATKVMMGGLIGAEASVKPVARFPLALQLAGSIGALMQARPENVADGYTPFNDGFSIRHARFGLAWNYQK